jgi:hypothetical protein
LGAGLYDPFEEASSNTDFNWNGFELKSCLFGFGLSVVVMISSEVSLFSEIISDSVLSDFVSSDKDLGE